MPNVNDNGNIGGIFILDFITSNEELKNNCKLIIEHFNKSVPLVGYYSLEKEYDEVELKKIAETQEGYLVNTNDTEEDIFEDEEAEIEKEDIEDIKQFIKDSILRVTKASRYSYLTIPNGIIGSAVGAENTKRTWLSNPDNYIFKTKKKPGYIAGEYSLNGGDSFKDLSIKGDPFNIDDVTNFTYLLFNEMGVLDTFKRNGYLAISHMNERGYFRT